MKQLETVAGQPRFSTPTGAGGESLQRDDRPLVDWDNEGGAFAAPDKSRASKSPPKPRLRLGHKPEDTAEGCRAMAAADRERAVAMDTDRMRFRIERSADAWTKRADLLERLEGTFNARRLGAIDGGDGNGEQDRQDG